MTQEKENKVCPTCDGKKVVSGVCECSSEWRGTQSGDDWDDCQCTPEEIVGVCVNSGGSAKSEKLV